MSQSKVLQTKTSLDAEVKKMGNEACMYKCSGRESGAGRVYG